MKSILDAVAGFLVQQSWQIPILLGFVLVACWALRNASAHWRYLLWTVLIAKCLTPPMVHMPLAVLPEDERPRATSSRQDATGTSRDKVVSRSGPIS
ncbi:MAG: hypothetical protein AAF961_02195, partial [Planctomycetota bacterium]